MKLYGNVMVSIFSKEDVKVDDRTSNCMQIFLLIAVIWVVKILILTFVKCAFVGPSIVKEQALHLCLLTFNDFTLT